MNSSATLVLAMGNDILGDDGVALFAARRLRPREGVDVVESCEAGLALLEYLIGYDDVLILDAIRTGMHPPGSVLHFTAEDFRAVVAPSPHYAGLPEVLALGARLNVSMPKRIHVLAMEVEDPYSIREEMSASSTAALPAFVREVESVLLAWRTQHGEMPACAGV
jgi:hydrogenase maturation protease